MGLAQVVYYVYFFLVYQQNWITSTMYLLYMTADFAKDEIIETNGRLARKAWQDSNKNQELLKQIGLILS